MQEEITIPLIRVMEEVDMLEVVGVAMGAEVVAIAAGEVAVMEEAAATGGEYRGSNERYWTFGWG